jgi:hypothetical protein
MEFKSLGLPYINQDIGRRSQSFLLRLRALGMKLRDLGMELRP